MLPHCFDMAHAEDAAEVVAEETEESSGEEEGEAPQSYEDSAKELTDKLGQLSELLNGREDADPELKDKLEGLKAQLGSLGVDLGVDLGGGRAASKELTQFVSACMTLSTRRTGLKRPTTTGALRSLAKDGFTKEQAKDMDLAKMVAVCITELSDAEFDLYKAGKLTQLSKEMERKSQGSEGKSILLALEDDLWKAVGEVSKGLVKQLGGDDPRKSDASSTLGLLAFIPILGGVGFLAKKFFDMQKENEARKVGKKGKKQK